ncbi:MAG: dihydroorotate dehydrogenase electron transfer subunit [Desulfovibrio sp.]|nr:dihydroorotate dehydrogenase electron transfer subunit [Desulfovibrio sp.]
MPPHASYTHLTVLDIVPFGSIAGKNTFFALRLSRPDWPEWQPGQFVMIRPDSFGLEIPWPRPLGICDMNDRYLICFFQVLGRGTERLAQLSRGETVAVTGPLGKGFHSEVDTPTLLLAGGMGIVPFIGYVRSHPQPWNLSMVFGHRPPLSCYPIESLRERIPVDILRETIPGDLDNLLFTLHERIHDYSAQNGLILGCGPKPFLRTLYGYGKSMGARMQLSLENTMACGVGACLGCVTKTAKTTPETPEYVQTCTKGPVFWIDQIVL